MKTSKVAKLTSFALAMGFIAGTSSMATAAPAGTVKTENKTVFASYETTVVPSYTQALAALPDASRAMASTRTRFFGLKGKEADAAAATAEAYKMLADANAKEVEANRVYTAAANAANAAQQDVDSAAREMYMTGGQPAIIEIVLTATDEETFSRALDMRDYLDTASQSENVNSVEANQAYESASRDLASAQEYQNEIEAKTAEAIAQHDAIVAEIADAEQDYNKAQAYYNLLMQITSVNPNVDYIPAERCGNWLVKELYNAGFRDENLREAWAIAMRESGGREDAISASDDWGVFQFNRPTWGGQSWWDDELILTRDYNIAIAYQMSDGGRTWYPWGLDGRGRVKADVYYNSGWSEETVRSHIIEPYLRWYEAYPCVDRNAPSEVLSGETSEEKPAGGNS